MSYNVVVQLVLAYMFFPKWKSLSDRIIDDTVERIELSIHEKIQKQLEEFSVIRGNYTNELTTHLDREISQLKNTIHAGFVEIRKDIIPEEEIQRRIQIALDNFDKKSKED